MNHKTPACPGAGNARQVFGGRFLCKMNHKLQSKLSENACNLFAGIFLVLEARMELSERGGTQEVSQEARPRARMAD